MSLFAVHQNEGQDCMTERSENDYDSIPQSAVDAIDAIFARVQQPLIVLADQFVEISHSCPGAITHDESGYDHIAAKLEPSCRKTLTAQSSRLIVGVGLVGFASDRASGMIWWRVDNQKAARKYHVFNPESDSFYDYQNSMWFQDALQTEGLAVVGPYIDAWGTDDHAMTASMKIEGPNGPVGVAAADLDIHVLVDELEEAMSDLPNWVLVGAEDRIIASDIALMSPGLHLTPYLLRSHRKIVRSRFTHIEGWTIIQLE